MSANQYKQSWKKKTAAVIYSIVAMFSIQVSVSQAQSNVSGTLSDGKHRWTADNNPYVMTETVVVPQDGKLVIESGVVVQGHEGVRLRVEGSLEANGTREEPVSFGTFDEETRWSEIELTSTAKPSRLTGTIVSHSNFVGIINEASDLTIERCVIFYNTIVGIGSSGNNLHVSQTHIQSTLVGIQISSGNSHIENSTFVDLVTGISIDLNADSTIHTVVHSSFDNIRPFNDSESGGAIVTRIFEDSQSSVLVENSIITNSKTGFNRIENAVGTGVSTTIRSSNVWGTTYPLTNNVQVDDSLLSEDPLYVDQASRNLRLKKGSPCIDSAVPILGIALDYDLEPRVLGKFPDMGAFEHSAAPRCGDGKTDPRPRSS